MPSDQRTRLASIRRFDQLVAYLRDDMGWPIDSDNFEELTFEYTPEELGIDAKNAAKIQEIKRLRPLVPSQPWGIFFVKFEPKRLPVVALRRILGQVALKKRASANKSERQSWAADDLLFVSNYGEGGERQIAFAHFAKPADGADLPTLKVLGWDNLDTPLHLDDVAEKLARDLAWPDDPDDEAAWRTRWRRAFTLRPREVVTTSRELSIRLAELARTIRDRIKTALAIETEKGLLTQLLKAFQTALIHDLDADGFADMYAQTIAYGLLSARIADPHRKTADDFAAHMRTNPFLRELMETFLKVGGRRGKAGGPGIDFDELGVSEVVELLDDANMEAVVLDFGDRNPQEDPVIHFYELFLKEYDAKKRMQRGVFYTPRPVVSYIVRSVDELLRTEFGLADGLADTTTWGEMAKRHKDLKIPEGVSPEQNFVQILDPATGTGTFLVEVIDLVHKTLVAKWKAQGHGEKTIDALWNEYVPAHLLTRLHGYELLMAPYAIAHLKIGLKLYETGYRFGSDERARVYLTNALEPASSIADATMAGLFDALGHEAQAVNEIKRRRRFTIVIGNPPYSKMSGNLSPAAASLIDPFREVAGARIVMKAALAHELNLQDDYVKFYGLMFALLSRSGAGIGSYISNFGYLDSPSLQGMRWNLLQRFDELNFLNIGGRVADRRANEFEDENVFEIEQGVAVSAIVCFPDHNRTGSGIRYGRITGTRAEKYRALLAQTVLSSTTVTFDPIPPFYRFVPSNQEAETEFNQWEALDEIFLRNSGGIITSRDSLCINADPDALVALVARFANSRRGDTSLQREIGFSVKGKWDVEACKAGLRDQGVSKRGLKPVLYRPFDVRHIYYYTPLLDTPSRPVSEMVYAGRNILLLAPRVKTTDHFCHVLVSRSPAETKACTHDRATQMFPTFVRDPLRGNEPYLNLSPRVVARFSALLDQSSQDATTFGTTFLSYAYALLHSPSYRARYGAALRNSYPRVPVPGTGTLAQELGRLGGELVALHLLESPKVNRHITEFIGGRSREVEKISWSESTAWVDKAQTTGFKGVREEVWNFSIGGYQVCEKWLKDRKGRRLSKDDIEHYQKIVVALSETIRLMKEIDKVIEQHGGWPGAFQAGATNRIEEQQLLKVAEPRATYGAGKGRDEKEE